MLWTFICQTTSVYLDLTDRTFFSTTSSYVDVQNSYGMFKVINPKFKVAIMYATHRFSISFAQSLVDKNATEA